jgi:hypothetical protein
MRRSALNHNWLQNQYLVFLLALIEYTTESFVDPGFEATAAGQLRAWETHQSDMLHLLNTCADELSPRLLLKNKPLAALNEYDQAWLGDVVHNCWVARTGIEKLVSRADNCLKTANAIYSKLVTILIGNGWPAHETFALLTNELRSFHTACSDLALAISRLPSKLEIA